MSPVLSGDGVDSSFWNIPEHLSPQDVISVMLGALVHLQLVAVV